MVKPWSGNIGLLHLGYNHCSTDKEAPSLSKIIQYLHLSIIIEQEKVLRLMHVICMHNIGFIFHI